MKNKLERSTVENLEQLQMKYYEVLTVDELMKKTADEIQRRRIRIRIRFIRKKSTTHGFSFFHVSCRGGNARKTRLQTDKHCTHTSHPGTDTSSPSVG